MASAAWSPTIRRYIYWLGPAALFVTQVGTIQNVRGRSMQPTFNPDSSRFSDVVLLDRLCSSALALEYGEKSGIWKPTFKRGDVVVMKSPTDPDLRIIKRVVAVANDVVKTLPPYPLAVVHVPEGHIWVEGDEYFHSRDSNTFGPASTGLIEAKIKYIVWPPSRIGSVPAPPARSTQRVFSISDSTATPF